MVVTGSGVFYNVGRSAVFKDHSDAHRALIGGGASAAASINGREDVLYTLASKAAEQGYDSIQVPPPARLMNQRDGVY